MRSTRWGAVVAVLLAATGCGGDSVETADSLDEIGTTVVTINLADGAFERNESTQTGGALPADTAGDTAPSTVPGPTTVPGAGETAPTTQPGQLAPSTVATTAPSDTTTAMRGLVTIDSVSYPFVLDTCEYESVDFFAFGAGTSSAGSPFAVTIVYEAFDSNGDGVDEISFDLTLEPSVAVGVDLSTLPDFYASKVDGDEDSGGKDITVSLVGARISGAGPIADYNGVAIPDGETLPMTFEAQCA